MEPNFVRRLVILCIISFMVIFQNSGCHSNDELRVPSKKYLVQECTLLEPKDIARFYEMQGSHATTSDGYLVTFQMPDVEERVIFYAYSSPGISEIKCEHNSIVLIDRHRDPYVLPLDWVKNELVFRPIRFYKMQLRTLEYEKNISGWDDAYVPTPTP